MPSPFPGMNPYLERAAVWSDFHARFIPQAADALAGQVAPRYFVKVGEHVYLHERSADERKPLGRPDVSVHPAGDAAARGVAVATSSPAPSAVFIPDPVDEVRVPFLEVRDRTDRQVVTVVELVSPANKTTGADRDQYWNKVRTVLKTGASLVEIDLLRGGPRLPWRDMPACDYYALVSRYPTRPRVDFWPIALRDPLPVIPVPLSPGDPEASLDLQSLVHRIYDAGYFSLFLYDGPPEPALRPDDAAWAAGLLTTPAGG